MCGIIQLALLLSLFSLQCHLRLGNSKSILIISLPQSDKKAPVSWERGEEILPGALTAIEEANNGSLAMNLTQVVVNSSPVARYDVLEVIASLTWQKRVSDITGITGVLHPNVLAALNRLNLPVASLIHFKGTPIYSNVLYMTASTSTVADSILAFMKEIRPRKIGTITETKQPYLTISNELSTKANISLHFQLIDKHFNNKKVFSGIADRMITSNVHVMVMSVGPHAAISMLCEAYERELTWPKYAWVLHSYGLDDLLRSLESTKRCSNRKILEGVFIFQLTEEKSKLLFNVRYSGVNLYADLLYKSVWALITLSVDSMSFAHLSKPTSPLHFSPNSSKVYIYQITLSSNDSTSIIGIYDEFSHNLRNVSQTTFTDELPIVYEHGLFVLYLLPLPILCLIFNTISLVLYVYFHNRPSVKSTSVSLSLLIFAGCYLMVGFTVVDIPHEQHKADFCMSLTWLSLLGLSLPLVLATILVKMLRVYHIFTTFKVLQSKACMSDLALLVYTLLILSPNILILTLWTILNPNERIDEITEFPGYIQIHLLCESDYDDIFFALLYVYLFTLSAAVIIVAIKSRKIRLVHFKDTKKVNIFIILLFMIVTSAFAYTYICSITGLGFAAIAVRFAGHSLAAFLCQIILFVPKLWPLLKGRH